MDEFKTCREQPLADFWIGWPWHSVRNRTSGRAEVFQNDGNALPGADAHAGRAVTDVPLPQFGCQRQDVAGAGGAEGVSNGHRATVGVELVIGNGEAAELVGQFTKHAESPCAEPLM